MATNLQTVKASFFTILKSGAPGTAVRAALGSGGNSVITRRGLTGTLPTAPFVVVQYGPVPGARFQVRSLFAAWWLYDDLSQDWYRLNALVPLIEAAYPKHAIALCETDLDPSGMGAEITDSALKRPALVVRFIIKWRS